MRWRVLLVCLVAGSAAHADQECQLSAIERCANANELVWTNASRPALDRFLERRKVGWLGRSKDIATVVEDALSGPPDDTVRVDGELLRFSAVRPQSALERGVLFVTADGKISAAGVLHFNCENTCESTYSLSVMVSYRDHRLEQLVRAWGDEQMHLNASRGYEKALATISDVEVLTAEDQR